MGETILFGPGGQKLPSGETEVDANLPRAIELSKDKGVQSILYALRTGFRLQAFAAQLLHSYQVPNPSETEEGSKRLLLRNALDEQVDAQGSPLPFDYEALRGDLKQHAVSLIDSVLSSQRQQRQAAEWRMRQLDQLIRKDPVYFRLRNVGGKEADGLQRGRTVVIVKVSEEDRGEVGLLLQQMFVEDDVRAFLLSSVGGPEGASIRVQERGGVLEAEQWAGFLSKQKNHPLFKWLRFSDVLIIDRPSLGLGEGDQVGLPMRINRMMQNHVAGIGSVLFLIMSDQQEYEALFYSLCEKGRDVFATPAEVRTQADEDGEEVPVLWLHGTDTSSIPPRTQDPSYQPPQLPDEQAGDPGSENEISEQES